MDLGLDAHITTRALQLNVDVNVGIGYTNSTVGLNNSGTPCYLATNHGFAWIKLMDTYVAIDDAKNVFRTHVYVREINLGNLTLWCGVEYPFFIEPS